MSPAMSPAVGAGPSASRLSRGGSAPVLLVGLSFRSAPVSILERVSLPESELPKLHHALLDGEAISEAMVLSTCNRMELYTVSSAFHSGLDHVIDTLATFAGLTAGDLESHLYVHYADAAAEHMLTVAAGLDSMVVGEQQILGQLRSAYTAATEHDSLGSTLHELTQRALRTGKRVHTETDIDGAGASMVSFSVDRALRSLPEPEDPSTPLAGRRVLIIGAGAMASLASTYVGKLGVDHITVANRTLSRAENLVAHAREAGVDATAVPLMAVPDVLVSTDLVITATGAVGFVVHGEDVAYAQHARGHAPQVLIDLSMPRDIDDAAAAVDGITLLNIEQLTTMAGNAGEEQAPAQAIVAHELREFIDQQRAQAVVPTVKALRQRAGEVVADELLTLERATPTMSPQDRAAVEKAMRRVVDKLLHTPTVQAKKLSGTGARVDYSEALASLFNLPIGAVSAVTTATATADPAPAPSTPAPSTPAPAPTEEPS